MRGLSTPGSFGHFLSFIGAAAAIVALMTMGSLPAAEAESAAESGTTGTAEQVGPFALHHTGLDPAALQPAWVARDGTVASVQATGDDQQGDLALQLWAGDNQAGGWGYGGVNLHGPAAAAAWIGLRPDWSIRQGVDPLGSWIYYPRFVQDAVLTVGYARAAADALPSSAITQGLRPYGAARLPPWLCRA